jgi:hypothetical protein
MSSGGGTLEALIGELTKLLGPLTALTPDAAPAFLLDLGLPLTDAQATLIGTPLGAVAQSFGKLLGLTFQLETAIQASDWTSVLDKGATAIAQIGKLISAFQSLETAIHSLGLANATAILATFPADLFSYLLAHYLGTFPYVVPLLQALGVLVVTDHNVGSVDPTKPFYTTNQFHLDRVTGWLSNPGAQLQSLYKWNTPQFDGGAILAIADQIIGEAGLPVLYATSPPLLDVFYVRAMPFPTQSPTGIAVSLDAGLSSGSAQLAYGNWTLDLALDAPVLGGTQIFFQPGKITVQPPESTTLAANLTATYTYATDDSNPLTILGVAGSSGITVTGVSATAGLGIDKSGAASLTIGAQVIGGKATISMADADGFIGSILGGVNVENTFTLGVEFSTDQGVHFSGSSALDIQLASHIDLGPVQLDALTLTAGLNATGVPVQLTTDLTATVGPLAASVQGIGFELDFTLANNNSGNLGPIDLSAKFVPPTGVGLSIDAGVVTGGGYLFFDPDHGEYGGALQLEICDLVNAKAIGVITTKMPDGSSGFALIIIITCEFTPPFQLGYGFTLNGVGGLLGLNRTVDLQALRDAVRTDAIENILFPSDVIGNAPQIISDLRTLFPVQEGSFLIGPMAKLGWGTPTLISLTFGLIVEVPTDGSSPKIAILGVLKIALPTDDLDLIKIQVNFIGTLDFDLGLLAFDADLYDSHILFLTLEGSLAVRVKWKDPAGFLVSIGGFHPSYTPPPDLQVPPMQRLAINILDTSVARIRVETYFAVTSNSVQTGARAELYFGFSAFYVDGYIGFDALFQFSPFYFEVDVQAGLALHVFGADLLSISLAFSLSGPSPWHAWGTGSITILFWTISADFDITWGDSTPTTLPDVKVLPLLLADLNDPSHWRALLPTSTNLWVSLVTPPASSTDLVLHPAGRLAVQQKTAPLGLTWQKFGQQNPADINSAILPSAVSGAQTLSVSSTTDSFALSQFENMSDAQKLSVPQFQQMDAGAVLAMGNDAEAGTAVARTLAYNTTIIDIAPPPPPLRLAPVDALHNWFLGGTAKKRAPSSNAQATKLVPYQTPTTTVVVAQPTYTVASTATNQATAGTTTFASQAAAQDYMAKQVAANPNLGAQLHVIPTSEAA